MKTTHVFKFGGSSFPTLDSYHDIARYVSSRLREDSSKVVLVVSAMSGTTGRILEAGLTVNPALSPEITDSMLGTGEMVAACLMRAALQAAGLRAAHLTGYQNGILTDSAYTHARIERIDTTPYQEAFVAHDVVVVAGGQARDAAGKLTMLGRNSSDLSAVALAGALGLAECEIFSDVPGVYSADPYLVEGARLLREVPFDSIIEMSRSGAKVLHHGAVECAKRAGVRILCRGSSGTSEIGSVIGAGAPCYSVTLNKKVAAFQFDDAEACGQAWEEFVNRGVVAIIPGARELVVSTENLGWLEIAVKACADASALAERCLVTELRADGSVRRYLLRESAAETLVKSLHAVNAPNAGEDIVQEPRRMEKRRSSSSGLLVAAPA